MRIKRQLAGSIVVVMAAFLMLADTASADSFGSSGGSWGSGSSGSSVFGGRRGGPVRNLLARAPLRTMMGRARNRMAGWGSSGGSHGSSGGYGSSGGRRGYGSSGGSTGYSSVGSYVSGGSSGGSWGSSRSYGSSGGGSWGSTSNYNSSSHYAVPAINSAVFAPSNGTPISGFNSNGGAVAPMETSGTKDQSYYNSGDTNISGGEGSVIDSGTVAEPPAPGGALAPPADGTGAGADSSDETEPTPRPDDTTMNHRLQESMIDVTLPSDAQVYVNGKLTKKTGEYRTFVARHQNPESKYRYEITAIKDGKKKVETFTMRAGGSKSLNFDFSTTTVVELLVPKDATVELAGNMTDGSGVERKFTTKKLDEGQTWDDYKVVVTYEKDGETVVREKTLSVVGGNAYTLDFASSVDATSVAVKKP